MEIKIEEDLEITNQDLDELFQRTIKALDLSENEDGVIAALKTLFKVGFSAGMYFVIDPDVLSVRVQILQKLQDLCFQYPQLRVGQIVAGCDMPASDIFNIPDQVLLEKLSRYQALLKISEGI